MFCHRRRAWNSDWAAAAEIGRRSAWGRWKGRRFIRHVTSNTSCVCGDFHYTSLQICCVPVASGVARGLAPFSLCVTFMLASVTFFLLRYLLRCYLFISFLFSSPLFVLFHVYFSFSFCLSFSVFLPFLICF